LRLFCFCIIDPYEAGIGRRAAGSHIFVASGSVFANPGCDSQKTVSWMDSNSSAVNKLLLAQHFS